MAGGLKHSNQWDMTNKIGDDERRGKEYRKRNTRTLSTLQSVLEQRGKRYREERAGTLYKYITTE